MSANSNHLSGLTRAGIALALAAIGTAAPSSSAGASAPSGRQPVEPTAGAADYLHFGRTGLCVIGDGYDWAALREGSVVIDDGVIHADPPSEDTFLEVTSDSLGTATPFDDELVVRLYWYPAGPDEMTELRTPMWADAGGIGGFTTTNTPSKLAVKRIEFRQTSNRAAVVNQTRVPMHAVGWFDNVAGHNGFSGGSGPDCVEGSGHDDRIATGGGDDFARGLYGDDSFDGGPGNDTMDGGGDDDKFRGRDGVDRAIGGTGTDCFSDSVDGNRDVFDDAGGFYADLDSYVPEPGVVNGVAVPTIDVITEAFPFFVVDCI